MASTVWTMRLEPEQKARWEEAAKAQAMTLSDFVKQSVEASVGRPMQSAQPSSAEVVALVVEDAEPAPAPSAALVRLPSGLLGLVERGDAGLDAQGVEVLGDVFVRGKVEFPRLPAQIQQQDAVTPKPKKPSPRATGKAGVTGRCRHRIPVGSWCPKCQAVVHS